MTAAEQDRHCLGCSWDGTGPHCHLCHEPIPAAEFLDHLRVLHPDVGQPGQWPDGGWVVVDTTLNGADFG